MELNRLAYSVKTLAQCLGVSIAFLRTEIKEGRLKVSKVGRRPRILIKTADVETWLRAGSTGGDVD